MAVSDIEAFKAKIEDFLTAHDMNPTQFGKLFANDPLFVFQIRDGREPRSQTRQKIASAMDAHVREDAA